MTYMRLSTPRTNIKCSQIELWGFEGRVREDRAEGKPLVIRFEVFNLSNKVLQSIKLYA